MGSIRDEVIERWEASAGSSDEVGTGLPARNDQLFKADAGKLRPSLLIEGVPRALYLITAVLSYGAQKYEAHSWKAVAQYRYTDAKLRHMFDELVGFGLSDEESGLLHKAHEICNALFILEQNLEALSPAKYRKLLSFNAPPQGHKGK